MGDKVQQPPPQSPKNPKQPKRRKSTTLKLPTPPPDPQGYQPPSPKSSRSDDFLTYLDALMQQKTLTNSNIFAPVVATEDAFDHLEKLYKLMEQMLELREQNARLHRKVRDLEHVNNLERMQRDLEQQYLSNPECPELDQDTQFAETILESILSDSKSSRLPSQRVSVRKMAMRNRSESVAVNNWASGHPDSDQRRASTCLTTEEFGAKNKVSKWTKVKAAFKWEKAAEAKPLPTNHDSGLVPVNLEVARYLRVPSVNNSNSTSNNEDQSYFADSGGCTTGGLSTPGTLSTASSTEDFHHHHHHHAHNRNAEDFIARSSDDEHHNYIPKDPDSSGSQKSKQQHHHKTPWAKMKDIIHTRNSLKKKHRLSAQSDDIQIDIEPCSDNNEDVFEDDPEVPPDVVKRYRESMDDTVIDSESRKVSKWTKVKKAFLHTPPSHSHPQTPPSGDDKTIHEEIQHNYKQLQKKLSLEFQEKLSEWERMRQNSPAGTSNAASSIDEPTRDTVFMKKMEEWQKMKSQQPQSPVIQMQQENLPPEFKKKLQEWEKIRKTSSREKKKLGEVPRWKSMRETIEYPPITDDFRKKLEEWKQIRENKTSGSPKVSRKQDLSPKQSNASKKNHQPVQELQWFEKQLCKIEKEKQRLEHERQKFIEREERLSKLRSSVTGGHSNKKEVLIHTPSGFYRFEGISRKFTQKLYEWEKAQGISPESSTFALLKSSLDRKSTKGTIKEIGSSSSRKNQALTRSKSADSIAISALNLTCPLMTHQPSSLSLNDVDNLEKECLNSKSSSICLNSGVEDENEEEPEALIVEFEDIVEETAAPLRTYAFQKSQPVYQRQEIKAMCEGETCKAPRVRRSESSKAQNNFNLIEEVISILKNLTENELEIQKAQEALDSSEDKKATLIKLKMFDESQKAMSIRLSDKISRLQEVNSHLFHSREPIEPRDNEPTNATELDTVTELSKEMFHLVEKLDSVLNVRNVYETFHHTGASSLNPVIEISKDIHTKILDLRRTLCFYIINLNSDLDQKTVTYYGKKEVHKKSSTESTTSEKRQHLYAKSDNCSIKESSAISQGAIKKKIRYRQKSQSHKTLPIGNDTDDDEDEDLSKSVRHKKLTRTNKITKLKPLDLESTPDQLAVPTQVTNIDRDSTASPDSPVTVFVKTTRKIFTPIGEVPNLVPPSQAITHLPPLPGSPTPSRKVPTKDISPSIRLMLAKYNQKITDDKKPVLNTGTNNSGTSSPVGWRSPKSERKLVKAQTEKYQEEVLKNSTKGVQKSASVGVMSTKTLTVEGQVEGPGSSQNGLDCILKSSSASALVPSREEADQEPLEQNPRTVKLQKAKEQFFNTVNNKVDNVKTPEAPLKYPERNRLSQISVDSSASSCYSSLTVGNNNNYDGSLLMKSASAGMINVDSDAYKQFELHGGGYVSLPRNYVNTKNKSEGGNFFSEKLSNIASKFRKVKMRKGKDKKPQAGAISALCRQSLLVDITGGSKDLREGLADGAQDPCGSSNDVEGGVVKDSDSVEGSDSNRGKSWKLFKK